jgi:glycogen debranching enzyme
MQTLPPTGAYYLRQQRGSIGIRILVALVGVGLVAAGLAISHSQRPAPGSFYADIDSLSQSGLELSRNVGPKPQFCCAIGGGLMTMGLEDGTGFEGWQLPYQAFYDMEIAFEAKGRRLKARKLVVRPEATMIYFGDGRTQARVVLVAPVLGLAGSILAEGLSTSPVTATFSFVPSGHLIWPGSTKGSKGYIEWDRPMHAFVLTDLRSRCTAVMGGAGRPSICTDEDQPSRFRGPRRLPVTEVARCRLQFVLGKGASQALFTYAARTRAKEAKRAFRLSRDSFRESYVYAVSYYRRYLGATTSVDTTNESLVRAFDWAKIGLDKCFVKIPGVGSGYAAGYNRSCCGFRPGFAWFVGRDIAWMSFAACCIGEFDKARSSLDLLARYQIRKGEQRGKIPHEIAATGEPIYSAGDATPLWVVALYRYWEWTDDTGYLEKMWPQVVVATDWCYRQDTDGDLLIDNPPAGHEWYDYGGRNMIDLEAIWAKALASAASIAEVLSERIDSQAIATALKWAQDARKVGDKIDREFWNEGGGYFDLRQESPGVFDQAKTANPSFALLWHLVDPEKAERQLHTWQAQDMLTGWGVRTLSNRDRNYDPEGYHEGRVWPYVNGLVSLAAFAQDSPDFGYELLRANAKMIRDFALGWIPETLRGDRYEACGTPFQGWSESMVIQPIIERLAGLEPETLTFSPSFPSSLNSITLKRLNVRGKTFHVELAKGHAPHVTELP